MNIRIITIKEKGIWSAMSLDLGLAAQSKSKKEAIDKLSSQIDEYITEAFDYKISLKDQLLSRKGPVKWFLIYYLSFFIKMAHTIRSFYVKTLPTTSPISG